MAENGKHRWVVLLNKSPKGPLTEDEVKTLLNQGILRPNDIAYQVDSSDPKAHTEWKLIWQFTEFNRRQPESFTGEQTTPRTKKEPDRRQPAIVPEDVKKRALEDLPPDLLQITPEDLLPKTTSLSLSPEPDGMGALTMDSIDDKSDRGLGFGAGFDMRWAYGAGGFLVLSFAILQVKGYFSSSTTGNKRLISPQESAGASPANPTDTRRIAPTGSGTTTRALATPSARAPEAPQAREREREEPPPPDRGRMERPDEDRDENYDRATDGDEAPAQNRRGKKRRKPAKAANPDEEDGGDEGDSYQDASPAAPAAEEAEAQSEYDE